MSKLIFNPMGLPSIILSFHLLLFSCCGNEEKAPLGKGSASDTPEVLIKGAFFSVKVEDMLRNDSRRHQKEIMRDTIMGSILAYERIRDEKKIVDSTGYGKLYSIELSPGHVYILAYRAPGYVTKYVKVNTFGIPDSNEGRYTLNTNMSLFREGNGIEVMNEPVSEAHYNKKKDNFVWDRKMYRRRLQEIKERLTDH